jgi:hypothetical protein
MGQGGSDKKLDLLKYSNWAILTGEEDIELIANDLMTDPRVSIESGLYFGILECRPVGVAICDRGYMS